ncbi:hypothetical protein DYU11_11690 [Fibrisoma montanum]|uniref:Phosphoribosyl-ATP pyrophosphohydrolase n=1 Tax=Fibrisoma montanum TaxID=2305895 RepID=A0A418MB90_9BACT|nr:nucleoside triphosphate pyrophosphohydrolase family protein [Fibrisoma montanum]RIV23637.1 hypothetical protein DYU11_11690 [Fibrisoma montanum]
MKTSIEQVQEFHEVFNHPVAESPTIPDQATVDFRVKFIREELDELVKAVEAGDLVELADALGDIQYVLDGFFLNAGLHEKKDAILTEIHRSNMSKACHSIEHAVETMNALGRDGYECYYQQIGGKYIVKRRSDGKVMKALGYCKPNLKPIINHAK